MEKSLTISINTIEPGKDAIQIRNSNYYYNMPMEEVRAEQIFDIDLVCKAIIMCIHASDVIGKTTSTQMLQYVIDNLRKGINFPIKNMFTIKFNSTHRRPVYIIKAQGTPIYDDKELKAAQLQCEVNCMLMALIELIQSLEASNPDIYKREGIIASCVETFEVGHADGEIKITMNKNPSRYMSLEYFKK